MTERKYFGTDGVRGVAGQPPLTAAWVLELGQAAAEVLKRNFERPSVVIGKDTRYSGDMLEAALAAGLTARGVNVIHVGVMPTPGVSFLTRHLKASAGVVISASHNPYDDNGIKFFGSNGEKLSDSLELEIESLIGEQSEWPFVTGAGLGTVTNYREAERLYTDYLASLAPRMDGLRIALDCANGAAYRIAPKVFQRAGADVFAVYTTPDGLNINRNCGSTHMEHLRLLVREGDFDLGIAFDGDADRALLVDSRGNIIQGDHILYLTAKARGEKRVVTTIMANMGLEVKLRQEGIHLERTAVGDRYVHERMVEKALTLGGEQSGHILFTDISPTGDGILTALQVLKASQKMGLSLDQLHDDLVMFPQTLLNVKCADKHGISKRPEVQAAVKEAEGKLSGRGRINLRPSGTEPIVRVMVEGPDQTEIEQIAEDVADVIRSLQQ
ncbi:phosphoglucosamine mutase [Deinococcus cellulosilyticus]|uniref:Phosphoglucosamine mutase n=1 Tax=Deinococcus cellulosilyticus (strain DSM 18568 / NBRC 106333 / KACC 11606 / 5516J-15) TaxID=1223518 RepID=A0A511MXW3_DEIC1|nr:phosphoglucosamine mutase [Deinococcus cellulosilyticus]GEM44976.1 phosphoglucosamine mutase [Deinococcus cellulosilyticus NBRC 106333 = KACC 11606]